ncbi:MAG: hypothetical protein Q7S33_05505 [Nanoarchaeota archaeon]|nr:hypothetical protein [Nanoarchaeota archaeon]
MNEDIKEIDEKGFDYLVDDIFKGLGLVKKHERFVDGINIILKNGNPELGRYVMDKLNLRMKSEMLFDSFDISLSDKILKEQDKTNFYTIDLDYFFMKYLSDEPIKNYYVRNLVKTAPFRVLNFGACQDFTILSTIKN